MGLMVSSPEQSLLNESTVIPGVEKIYRQIQTGEISVAQFSKMLYADGVVPEFLNVGGFEITLQEYLKKDITGTLIAVDVDYFKAFNDSEGHPRGDDLLRLTGKILHEQTRTSEPPKEIKDKRQNRQEEFDILARAGDEFLVFLVGAEIDEAVLAAKRIRIAIEEEARTEFPNYPNKQTMSLGLTALKPDDTVRSIRQRADQALYEAKKGRGSEEITDSIALF